MPRGATPHARVRLIGRFAGLISTAAEGAVQANTVAAGYGGPALPG